MGPKPGQVLEQVYTVGAQGENLVSALGSTPSYAKQKYMSLRYVISVNINRYYESRDIYILSDSQVTLRVYDSPVELKISLGLPACNPQ
jgi:hypothetical protein